MPTLPWEKHFVTAEELFYSITHTEFNASVELALLNIQQQHNMAGRHNKMIKTLLNLFFKYWYYHKNNFCVFRMWFGVV